MSTITTWRVFSVDESKLVPLGYEQLTPAISTALNVPAKADIALINAEGGDIRWRDDGTDPTATVGMVIIDKDTIQYNGDLTAMRIISTGKANVSYYAFGG